jgi:hypothetical protein
MPNYQRSIDRIRVQSSLITKNKLVFATESMHFDGSTPRVLTEWDKHSGFVLSCLAGTEGDDEYVDVPSFSSQEGAKRREASMRELKEFLTKSMFNEHRLPFLKAKDSIHLLMRVLSPSTRRTR